MRHGSEASLTSPAREVSMGPAGELSSYDAPPSLPKSVEAKWQIWVSLSPLAITRWGPPSLAEAISKAASKNGRFK